VELLGGVYGFENTSFDAYLAGPGPNPIPEPNPIPIPEPFGYIVFVARAVDDTIAR
jgi:hypothetical protein